MPPLKSLSKKNVSHRFHRLAQFLISNISVAIRDICELKNVSHRLHRLVQILFSNTSEFIYAISELNSIYNSNYRFFFNKFH